MCVQYGYAKGCIVPGCDRDTKLHHIVPRRAGGTDAITNLVCICHTHEYKVHKAGHWARVQEADPTINIVNMARLSRWARKNLNRRLRTQCK